MITASSPAARDCRSVLLTPRLNAAAAFWLDTHKLQPSPASNKKLTDFIKEDDEEEVIY